MGTESKYVVIAGETATDAELKAALDMKQETTVWRVLKRSDADEGVIHWIELGTIEDRWPDASDLGEAFGEGDYLIFERESKYMSHSLRPISVVADKRWRERTEDES